MNAARREYQWVENSVFLLAGFYFVVFFLFGFYVSPGDFNHLATYYEISWRFWTTNGGIPHFNPFLCGGRTLGGDPQMPLFHPLLLLVPVLGPVLLVKTEMLLQLALGAYGLVKWMQGMGIRGPGLRWGLLLFLGGGGVVTRFMVGHSALGFLFLIPLLLHLSYRLQHEEHKHRYRLCYWAVLIYCGLYKPNFFIIALPLLGIETFFRSLGDRNWSPLRDFFIGSVISGVANAVVLLPAWEYFSMFPRTTLPDSSSLALFFYNLVFPIKTLPKILYGGSALMRSEYSLFIAPMGLFFAFWGMRKGFSSGSRGTHWGIYAMAVASLVLGLGATDLEFSVLRPWSWFAALWPGFSSIRVPVRFWFGIYCIIILFSAIGFERVRVKAKWVLILGILPLLGNGFINLSKPLYHSANTQWAFPRESGPPYEWIHVHPNDQYKHIRQGKSVIECSNNIQVHRSKDLKEGPILEPEIRSRGPVAWRGKWKSWNRFTVWASGEGPFSLQFNVNHSPYWKFEGAGGVTSEFGQRLELATEGNDLIGDLVFRQPLMILAMMISALGWATAVAYGFWVYRFARKPD